MTFLLHSFEGFYTRTGRARAISIRGVYVTTRARTIVFLAQLGAFARLGVFTKL